MPIVTIQRQMRELGRIRLGHLVAGSGGKKRPAKLDTWRLTSPDRALLEVAAAEYGGDVVPWPEAPDGDEHQLITGTDELEILVPPGAPLTQWNELWSGAGCQRRCDGVREWLKNVPCLCPADPAERNEAAAKGEACKPTSRLHVILPRLPDLGAWTYVSHGYYAAVELAGTADLLHAAASAGRMIPATLYIDQRTVKRPGQQTKKFPVPAIRIRATMTGLLESGGGGPALLPGGERIPARLETSAPLPTSTGFDTAAAGETVSGSGSSLGQTDTSMTPPPSSCTHPADRHVVTDEGVECGACGDVIATRSAPPPAPAAPPTVAPSGSLEEAQARAGTLAIRHRIVARLDADADWDAFDAAVRANGLEPPPNVESAEAIAEWDGLSERIRAGELDPAPAAAAPVDEDDPAGKCSIHGQPWKYVEAGTNAAGKAYNAFFACPVRDCKSRPSKAWRDSQRATGR
jgi:hypothetical protein